MLTEAKAGTDLRTLLDGLHRRWSGSFQFAREILQDRRTVGSRVYNPARGTVGNLGGSNFPHGE